MRSGRKVATSDEDLDEETFDYQRELGVSVQSLIGLKKPVFNSLDFGAITISTYAAAHA